MTPAVPSPAVPEPPPEMSAPGNDPSAYMLDPDLLPKLDDLVTQDDNGVDNIFTEKQERLFTEPLYSSWMRPGGGPFLAAANVGLFDKAAEPALVPDGLLSLDVSPGENLRLKENHSYFRWVYGKAPEVVSEIISDRRGGEESHKMRAYARMGVLFYVLFDPDNLLKGGVLRAYVLQRGKYEPINPRWFPEVGLGLTLWEGAFEGHHQTWLRWCDQEGRVIPTGAERAEEERHRAEEERHRAEEERHRAEEERHRAEEERRRADQANDKAQRLAAQLRALGIDPEA